MEENSFQVTEGNPLVSIIVITYNSSKYVLETLESAKAQTYKNIELIVSDDCSTDNTAEICRKWIEVNKERFVRTELITSERNTGIAPNCNRGLFAAKGEWIKYIAGDDILLENCIKDFVAFINKTPDCKIVFGRHKTFLQNENLLFGITSKPLMHFTVPFEKQKILVYYQACPSPESFINKKILIDVGGYDENYKFIEDHPLWLKLVNKNIYFYFINVPVVIYRIHESSITSNLSKKLINTNLFENRERLFKKEIIPFLFKKHKLVLIFNIYNELVVKNIIIFLGNKNNIISKILMLLLLHSTVNKMINKINNLKSHFV